MDGSGEQPRDGGPTSSEQIMKTGALLLKGFIQDQAEHMGGEASQLPLGPRVPQDASTKKLSECLKRIGDELDSNMELQRMIAAVDTDSPREVFFRVASEMFSDGNFNWGRVVALFYFASKLVLKRKRKGERERERNIDVREKQRLAASCTQRRGESPQPGRVP
ncbi:apoptosis regulator BAX isoform X1 [Myotis myotis]|uniref:apoptosis regulator BAX isoform X1 n=1 Tax=Myotis myotis TaxID=51298 RepID=UPI00174C5044|nr:apoptosis regulator BAX isoform X1 [Myotis myotis]